MTDSRGRFITLEGGEGAGKSTQVCLLADWLAARGVDVVTTREPGGSTGAEEIRRLLVQGEPGRWLSWTETLLFFAARYDHVERLVKPALDAGRWVICDRFADSTVAYQQYGRGLAPEVVAAAIELATGGLTPDLTVLLDLEPAVGHARTAEADDYLERADASFHERVRAGFTALAAAEPERWLVLDATLPAAEVSELAWARLRAALEGAGLV